MKIACQTITFGDEWHRNDIFGIVQAVASAGYQGIETGFLRLDKNKTQEYKKCLQENNLEQAGIHIGGNLIDPDFIKNQFDSVAELIELAKFLDCKNIFLSAAALNSEEEYKFAAENLNKLGKIIHESGLVFSYHNHAGEINNNCLGIYIYADYTDPEYLSFIPDVGWVTVGGADPAEVLKRLGKRVSNLHFKEFTQDNNFTELGKGRVNFNGVYEIIKNINGWIIAEQDVSSIGAEASVAENYRYIKSLAD